MEIQSAVRTAPVAGANKGRSAVTNRKRLHVVKPGDTAWARRFRDVLSEIISDLGGHDGLSEGQRQLARRAATISIECEKLEGKAARDDDINLETYGQLTDRLGRCFQRLGLKRQPRDVSTTLSLTDMRRLDRERQRQREADAQRFQSEPTP